MTSARRSTTGCAASRPGGTSVPAATGRRRRGGRRMSRLRDKLERGDFVVTAEMPVIDGGGMAEVARQLDFMAAYLDAVNATDNTAAHAHASPLAVALA